MTVNTYPQYSATAKSTWVYGVLGASTTGVYTAPTGTGETWYYASQKLNLAAGTYYLTNCSAVIAFVATDCTALYLAIMEDNGGDLSAITLGNGLTYIDMTADKGADGSHIMSHDIASVSFTLEPGKTYHWVLWLHAPAGHTASQPGVVRMDVGAGPQGEAYEGQVDQAAYPTTVASAAVSANSEVRGKLTLTTLNRIVCGSAYSAAGFLIVPRCTSHDYWIKFGSAVVANGQAFTCEINYDNDSAEATSTTLVLDMGVTDQVTFGGANVALAGADAEAGDTFDLGVNVRPDSQKADLFYCNRTTGQGGEGDGDFATISHACKNGSARAQSYSVPYLFWLDMSGTAAVGSIQVGYEPVVLFGDSQVNIAGQKLGYFLPTAFTHPRMVWDASISGNGLCTTSAGNHTAGYLRYKHGTPGQGDLCEMTGVVFVFCGFGVNDVSGVGTTAANRNKVATLFATRVAEILDDLQDRAIATLVIGLPPYSDATDASDDEAWCIKEQINPALEGLALAARCACLIPWWDMVESGTEDDSVPTFASGYTGDAGTHYNATGALLVSNLAVAAFESGYVGGNWIRRQGRRPGLLLPW